MLQYNPATGKLEDDGSPQPNTGSYSDLNSNAITNQMTGMGLPTQPSPIPEQLQDPLANNTNSGNYQDLDTNALIRSMTGYPLPTQPSPIPENLDVFKSMSPQPNQSPLDPNAPPPPAPQEETVPEVSPAKAKSSQIRALLDKVAPKENIPTPNKPPEESLTDDKIKALLDSYGQRKSNLGLMGIASDFSKNLGFRGNEDYLKREDEAARQPVEAELAARKAKTDAMQQQKLSAEVAESKAGADPTSPLSQAYRETARQVLKVAGLNDFASKIGDDLPASAVKGMLGNLSKIVDTKMAQDTKLEIAHENALNRAQGKSDAQDAKDTKRLDQANKMIQGALASSRGTLGKASNVVRSAEQIETLVSQGDPNNLTTQQVAEIAKQLDAMLSNGASTVSGTNKLIPTSAAGDLSKMTSYITNIPQGAQQAAFVKNILETTKREKDLANDQMKDYSRTILASYKDLQTKPNTAEAMKSILSINGLDPNILSEDYKSAKSKRDQINKDEALVKMQAPDGSIKMIPKSKVDAATKAGGKLVQ